MRLFIASPATIYDYDGLRHSFDAVLSGKWVEEENLHLTWYFAGELDSPDEIVQKLNAVEVPTEGMEIESLRSFSRTPQILYASVSESFVASTIASFERAGFGMKGFKAHVTLCRVKRVLDRKSYEKGIKRYEGRVVGKITPSIILYKSTLTPKGPIYEKLLEKGR
jgi:2'-5' RNA ligase